MTPSPCSLISFSLCKSILPVSSPNIQCHLTLTKKRSHSVEKWRDTCQNMTGTGHRHASKTCLIYSGMRLLLWLKCLTYPLIWRAGLVCIKCHLELHLGTLEINKLLTGYLSCWEGITKGCKSLITLKSHLTHSKTTRDNDKSITRHTTQRRPLRKNISEDL